MKNQRSAGKSPDFSEIFDTWIAGYDKANLDQVMSVFDPSVIYRAPCYPDKDFASLRKWFAYDFERSGARPHWTFQVDFKDTSGDLAVVFSQWVGYTDFDTRLQAEVSRFQSVDVLKLGPNGWKIIRTENGPEICCPAPAKAKPKTARKKK